jgi:hypothetical protein
MTRRLPAKPSISRQIERYATENAFVLKGKVIAPVGGRAGRPSVMTQEVVRKLEGAFVYDCSVEEACLYAGISRNTYYEFVKKYPAFQDRIEALRNAPYLVCRKTLIAAAEHDADLALKILERKRREEFSTRTEVMQTGEVSNKHYVDPEQIALIKQAMGNFAKKRQKMPQSL